MLAAVGLVGRLTGEVAGLPAAAVAAAGLAVGLLASGAGVDREAGLAGPTGCGLAGAARDHAVAWCHPVMSAAEARGVVTEASQLRAQAGRAAACGEPDLAQRLRHRADLLDGRLVDPLWRAFAVRALQVVA